MRVHSSAPTRIDLAGGTLDIWPLYLFHENAQTLNAAITLRAECTLCESTDGRLHVLSEDTRTSVDVAHWYELGDHSDLRLITCILRFFRVDGLSITTRSGFLQSTRGLGQGLMAEADIHAELGEILAGKKNGRTSAEEITLFDGTGLAFQDLIAGHLAMELAAENGAGVRVEMS